MKVLNQSHLLTSFRDYRNPDVVEDSIKKEVDLDVTPHPSSSNEPAPQKNLTPNDKKSQGAALIDYAYDYVKTNAKKKTTFQRMDGLVPRKRGMVSMLNCEIRP